MARIHVWTEAEVIAVLKEFAEQQFTNASGQSTIPMVVNAISKGIGKVVVDTKTKKPVSDGSKSLSLPTDKCPFLSVSHRGGKAVRVNRVVQFGGDRNQKQLAVNPRNSRELLYGLAFELALESHNIFEPVDAVTASDELTSIEI